VATPSALPVQLTTRRQRTDKIPPSSRALHGARCRCASTPRERTPALPPHRAVTSLYGPALLRVVRGYKKRALPFILSVPPPLPPSLTPVSHHRRALLLFLPCRRCRAASPTFCPRVQVLELLPASVTPPHPPPASVRLCFGEDRASPPVSTALSLPSMSGSSWSSRPCRAGSLMYSGRHRQDLLDRRSTIARRQWRHGQCALATCERAASWAASALRSGPHSRAGQCHVGHARPGQLGSTAGPRQAECALCVWATRLGFGPVAVLK
jgi:hypothetical protein